MGWAWHNIMYQLTKDIIPGIFNLHLDFSGNTFYLLVLRKDISDT